MANRLYSIFPTKDNDIFKVYIDDSSYAGSPVDITLAADGFHLQYSGSTEDMFGPVMGSSASVEIAVTDDTLAAIQSFANDLKTAPEGRFTLKILHNQNQSGSIDTLYWVGYILQDLSGFADSAPTYGFNVSATDGLARLKTIDYAFGGTLPVTIKTILEHVLDCLTQDGLDDYYTTSDIFLRTSINWQDGNIGAPAAAKCPFAYTRLNGGVFAQKEQSDTGEWKFKSCYEALKIICEHFAARLYYSSGSYRIEQVNERSQDFFYERRFAKNGTLLSSISNQGYDRTTNQASAGRLHGGVFGYIPALKSCTAIYVHDAAGNFLENYGTWWYINSVQTPQLVLIENINVGGDDFLRISGGIHIDTVLAGAYTQEWRYLFRLYIEIGTQTLDGNSTVVVVGGNPTTTINPVTPVWATGTNYYELSSTFSIADYIVETISFSFDTPPVPTGTVIKVKFEPSGAFTVSGTPVTTTDNYWEVLTPVLQVLDSTDPTTYFEKKRRYKVNNASVGNSDTKQQEFIFGHAVSGWTQGGLWTFNGTDWLLTTATWDYGTLTANYEFAKLWANEVMAARQQPRPRWTGGLYGTNIHALTRVIFADNTPWLMLRGEFTAYLNFWNGEWFQAGVNRVDLVHVNPVRVGGGVLGNVGGTGGLPPGIHQPQVGSVGFFGPANTAITALTTNIVNAVIPAGTVTSIPLRYAVKANAYLANDDILVVNTATGMVIGFTVATTAASGATSLSVVSSSISAPIPAGAKILYGPLNKYTGEGGNGMNLPPGTSGQILRYGASSWDAYSGATDGHVLTWDSANGWQAEAPPAGGSVSSVGLSMPAIFSVSGSPVTSSGTLAVSLATQSANLLWAGPASGAAAAPTFRAMVTADIPDAGVTYAKIQNVTDARLLGRSAGTAGVVQEISVGSGLSLSGGVLSSTVSGTVTSVGLSMPAIFSVSGSPVTSSGTLSVSLATQSANLIWAGPASGGAAAPTFRAMVTADIPNAGVTYAKIQNVTDARLLGRSAGTAGVVQEITVGSGLSLSGGVLSSTVSGTVTGTGVANRIAIWSSTSALTSSAFPLYWDGTNNYLGLGTATPAARVHVAVPTGTSDEGLRILGNLSGNLNNTISNANNANAGANTIVNIVTGGASAGDPIIQLSISGAITWAIGLDNSDLDKFKISAGSTPGSSDRLIIDSTGNTAIGTTSLTARLNVAGSGTTSATYSFQALNNTGGVAMMIRDDRRVGLLTAAPALTLDATLATDGIGLPNGTTAQRPAVTGAIRHNTSVGGLEVRGASAWYRLTGTTTPSISAGAAAGTSPTVSVDAGNDLCHQISVTTGASGTTTGTFCTVTLNQPLDPTIFTFVVFSARNDPSSAEYNKFYISATGGTSYVISCRAAPTVSTQFTFHVMVKQ